jgi:hypothetical protein
MHCFHRPVPDSWRPYPTPLCKNFRRWAQKRRKMGDLYSIATLHLRPGGMQKHGWHSRGSVESLSQIWASSVVNHRDAHATT